MSINAYSKEWDSIKQLKKEGHCILVAQIEFEGNFEKERNPTEWIELSLQTKTKEILQLYGPIHYTKNEKELRISIKFSFSCEMYLNPLYCRGEQRIGQILQQIPISLSTRPLTSRITSNVVNNTNLNNSKVVETIKKSLEWTREVEKRFVLPFSFSSIVFFVNSIDANESYHIITIETDDLKDTISQSKWIKLSQLDFEFPSSLPILGTEVSSLPILPVVQRSLDQYVKQRPLVRKVFPSLRMTGGLLFRSNDSCIIQMIKQWSQDNQTHVVSLSPSDITPLLTQVGQAEKYIKTLFHKARKYSSCILILQDVHVLFPQRDRPISTNNRLLGELLTLIDGQQKSSTSVVIVATTHSQPEGRMIDPALRRAGRIDKEIIISAPDIVTRRMLLDSFDSNLTTESLDQLCIATIGFALEDFQLLFREAQVCHWRSLLSLVKEIQPSKRAHSSDSSFQLEQPIEWSSIGGLSKLKKRLQRLLSSPFSSNSLQRFAQPRGILLYGPPGCSKSSLARAMCSQAEGKWTFFRLDPATVYSSYVGQAEARLRQVFAAARSSSPSVVFFDEIDALVGSKRGTESEGNQVQQRILSTLLNEMDGIASSKGVVIIAATNLPHCLDPALLRPGRFDQLIYVPPPDAETRLAILQLHLSQMPYKQTNPNELIEFARDQGPLQLMSGADLANLCRETALKKLRQCFESKDITISDLRDTAAELKPSLSIDSLYRYDQFQNQIR